MSEPTADATPATPDQPTGLTTGQKVKNAAYMTKCVLVGGIFLVAGIAVLVTGSEAWWVGLIGLAYGLWVLSGLATGGWRLFIY